MRNHGIEGQTLRWMFDDGPMKGKRFEHTFGSDGSVSYKTVGSVKAAHEPHYEVAELNDDVCAVSYLSSSGWTLTVMLDFRTRAAIGFASNDKQLIVQHGHFEQVRRAA